MWCVDKVDYACEWSSVYVFHLLLLVVTACVCVAFFPLFFLSPLLFLLFAGRGAWGLRFGCTRVKRHEGPGWWWCEHCCVVSDVGPFQFSWQQWALKLPCLSLKLSDVWTTRKGTGGPRGTRKREATRHLNLYPDVDPAHEQGCATPSVTEDRSQLGQPGNLSLLFPVGRQRIW